MSTNSRPDWTAPVWRLLCLLTLITAVAAVTGPYWLLPPLWQAISLAPGLVVMLLLIVAAWADRARVGGMRQVSDE